MWREMRLSAFMLSLISPVFQKMVCGAFKERLDQHLELDDVEQSAFLKILNLESGIDSLVVDDMDELLRLAALADRFQMMGAVTALEDAGIQHLSANMCIEVIDGRTLGVPPRLIEAGRQLAMRNFSEVSKLDSFRGIGEDMLSSILDDDRLVAESEEAIFEVVVKWMRGGGGSIRGPSLLKKIRFPLMDAEYLAFRTISVLPEAESLKDLVNEACMLMILPAKSRGKVLRHLNAKAFVPRSRLSSKKGVIWKEHQEGMERYLEEQHDDLVSLIEHSGTVCSSTGYEISVWNKSTLQVDRDISVDVEVTTLASFRDKLIVGHENGKLSEWDTLENTKLKTWTGHSKAISALTVGDGYLFSGSKDRAIKMWSLGESNQLLPVGTLHGHQDEVSALAVWNSSVISGSRDRTLRVWNIRTRQHETLNTHQSAVGAVLVHEPLMMSSYHDGSIQFWMLGTWELLHSTDPCRKSQIRCLAVSGSHLVTGRTKAHDSDLSDYSDSDSDEQQAFVEVWNLDTFSPQLSIPVKGKEIFSLCAVDDEVWGGVDNRVVIWGKKAET